MPVINDSDIKKMNAGLIGHQRPMGDLLKEEHNKDIENATLEYVYSVVDTYLFLQDKKRIDVLLAVVLSNQIHTDPVWLYLVGNSGDGKSATVRAMEALKNTIRVDSITKYTLASGKKGANDLGKKLANKSTLLLFPDLASMTSLNKDDKSRIWAQFRNLYDGFITRMTGNDVEVCYENCHVTMLACTTPVIRDEVLIHAQLGTRELMYDTDAQNNHTREKLKMAWENTNLKKEMEQALSYAMCNFIEHTTVDPDINITQEMYEFIVNEAIRLSSLRVYAIPDRRTGELNNLPAPEVPTRLIHQFRTLYVCLKSLSEDYTDKLCMEIITHVVNSSGNKTRYRIMETMRKNDKWWTRPEMALYMRLGTYAVTVQLEHLYALHYIHKEVRREQVGGWVDNEGQLRGGRMEDVVYYQWEQKNPVQQELNT